MSVPPRHPATAQAWAWLRSRPIQEVDTDSRDSIASTLMELDAELNALDADTTDGDAA